MPEIKNILANPKNYGFEFVDVDISTGGQGDKGTSLGTVPCPHVIDEALFARSFPGLIMRFLNGSSSIRVKAQAVGRPARIKNSRITNDQLRPMVLHAILEIRGPRAATTIEVQVYPMPDGSTTRDRAEFLEAYGLPGGSVPLVTMVDGSTARVVALEVEDEDEDYGGVEDAVNAPIKDEV